MGTESGRVVILDQSEGVYYLCGYREWYGSHTEVSQKEEILIQKVVR